MKYLAVMIRLEHHVDDVQVEHCVRNLLHSDDHVDPQLPPAASADDVQNAWDKTGDFALVDFFTFKINWISDLPLLDRVLSVLLLHDGMLLPDFPRRK